MPYTLRWQIGALWKLVADIDFAEQRVWLNVIWKIVILPVVVTLPALPTNV